MADIRIHDIPDDVYEVLERRARDSGRSLSQYVRALVIREARQPSTAEILARAAEHARLHGGRYSFEEVVEDLRRAREDARWTAALETAQEPADEIGVAEGDLAEAEKVLGFGRNG